MIKVPLKKNSGANLKPEPQVLMGPKGRINAYDIILGSVEIDTDQIPSYM